MNHSQLIPVIPAQAGTQGEKQSTPFATPPSFPRGLPRTPIGGNPEPGDKRARCIIAHLRKSA